MDRDRIDVLPVPTPHQETSTPLLRPEATRSPSRASAPAIERPRSSVHLSPQPSQTAVPPENTFELGLRPFIRLTYKYRMLIGVVLLVSLAFASLQVIRSPDVYRAQSTILPSGGQGQSGMLGLIASLTGAPPIAMGPEELSSYLFPRILASRKIETQVLNAEYEFIVDGKKLKTSLIAFLETDNIDDAIRLLEGLRTFEIDKETGILTVAATTPYPRLSAQIVLGYVHALEELILKMRRTAATLNNDFIQQRLRNTLLELTEAEHELTIFREQNRRINAPELELELLRLERDVRLKSQVFVTLTNQAEIARIEKAKDLPAVNVLDRAALPRSPVLAPFLSTIILTLIAGFAIAVTLIAGIELLKYFRNEFSHIRGT